jgi:hypothetical protein
MVRYDFINYGIGLTLGLTTPERYFIGRSSLMAAGRFKTERTICSQIRIFIKNPGSQPSPLRRARIFLHQGRKEREDGNMTTDRQG